MFGPLIVKPAKSKGSKTGSWRVKLRPEFLKKNCIGCKLCISVCPEACIQGKDKETIKINYEYCKGCGLCSVICPKSDILMLEEESKGDKK
ncbi:MAG: 4Fe-4S binding protein [Candidatus Omnitrophica bacterium]|nr:4Fe-4S binding protein [Candidatus Omnitrophota bacterium]MDD5553551.1 4Fe-4S binding protein [Candidatus Omnitrophota bacterium]